MWRLVADGVLNVRDIDSVMSDGLGMRYAFLGALETAHLNADGMKNYCERYNKSIYDVSWSNIQSEEETNRRVIATGIGDDGRNASHGRPRRRGDLASTGRDLPAGQIGRTAFVARQVPDQTEPAEENTLKIYILPKQHYDKDAAITKFNKRKGEHRSVKSILVSYLCLC